MRLIDVLLRDPAERPAGILSQVRVAAAFAHSDTVEINLPVQHKRGHRNAIRFTGGISGRENRVIRVLDDIEAFFFGKREFRMLHRHIFRGLGSVGRESAFSKSGKSGCGTECNSRTTGNFGHNKLSPVFSGNSVCVP